MAREQARPEDVDPVEVEAEHLRLRSQLELVKKDTARVGGKLALNGRVYEVLAIHDTHVEVRDDLGELVNWSRASFPPFGAERAPA